MGSDRNWQQVSFDFSSQAAESHNRIVLFFNFGVATAGTDVYQIDDVRMVDATSPADALAPMLSEAAVDGSSLVLTYSENLDTDSVPDVEAFTVEADSMTVTVSDVAINGRDVTLTLGEPVAPGQTVELDYTVPTGPHARPIQDAAGNDAAALTNHMVTNSTPGTMPSCPDPDPWIINDFECQQNQTVSDVTIVDNPDKSGANTSDKVGQFTDAAEAFGATIIDFGSAIDLSSRNQLGIKVRVPVAGPVVAKLEGGTSASFESPQVNVTQVGTWVDLSFDLSSQAAENHTKVALFFNFGMTTGGTDVYQIDDIRLFVAPTPEDAQAPMLSDAAVNGSSLVLTYSENLDTDSVPGVEAFTVEADSTTVTVSDVAIAGRAVTLTLGEPVTHGQTVELDYTVPTGSDARPIQDAAGNDAAELTNQSVRNRTLAQLEVQFGSANYRATEGGPAAAIAVSFDQAPHRGRRNSP